MRRSLTAETAAPRDAATELARQRLSALERAGELGTGARRNIVRTGFHDRRRRFQTHGVEGLKDLPPIHNSRPQTEAFERSE